MKKRMTTTSVINGIGGLSIRLIEEAGAEFVELFVRIPASTPKPVKRPKARKLKRRKRK